MIQPRGNTWKYALLVLLLGMTLEGLAFAACKVFARLGLVYDPAPVTNYAAYITERDTILGWPPPRSRGVGEYDDSGSRIVPAFPDPAARNCVALFGDSFTWGDEVSAEDAYGNVLARALGCRVANFGVGGYGTDQAVLRYEHLNPSADIVVLGYFSDDIVRNISQERGFLGNTTLGLKPRFLLRDGSLNVIPLPSLTEDQYARLAEDGASLLPYDYFRPGGPSGLVAVRFPHVVSAVRALGHFRIRAFLRGEASYAEFYRPEHSAGGLELTTAIVRRFVEIARLRDQTPLVLLIPDVKDLEALRAGAPIPYQPLVEELTESGIPFVSALEPLNVYLGDRSPCSLYFRCSGAHFRPEGYRELSRVVEQTIRQRGLLRVSDR